VTLVSLGLFAGAWTLAATGAHEDDLQRLYGGGAATVLLTPFALHRITGRRGSLRFAVLCSIGASALALYLTREHRMAVRLAAMLCGQLAASFLALRLTRRPAPLPDELDEI
jgi:hypothetical protein